MISNDLLPHRVTRREFLQIDKIKNVAEFAMAHPVGTAETAMVALILYNITPPALGWLLRFVGEAFAAPAAEEIKVRFENNPEAGLSWNQESRQIIAEETKQTVTALAGLGLTKGEVASYLNDQNGLTFSLAAQTYSTYNSLENRIILGAGMESGSDTLLLEKGSVTHEEFHLLGANQVASEAQSPGRIFIPWLAEAEAETFTNLALGDPTYLAPDTVWQAASLRLSHGRCPDFDLSLWPAADAQLHHLMESYPSLLADTVRVYQDWKLHSRKEWIANTGFIPMNRFAQGMDQLRGSNPGFLDHINSNDRSKLLLCSSQL